MPTYILIATGIALVAAISYVVIFHNSHHNRTFLYISASAMLLLSFGANAGVFYAGKAISVNDSLTFKEYWNGYETAATASVRACTRDGSCRHEYSCDPYTTTSTYTDANGNVQVRTETHYHQCPYSTEETTYVIETSVGDHVVAKDVMTGEQFRSGHSIPGGQVTEPPAEWLSAQDRIAAGAPLGVTSRHDYDNFVLATDADSYSSNEELILTYLNNNQLPQPAKAEGLYGVSKVYDPMHVLTNAELQGYTSDVTQLNGNFGSELQGDLHVVFIDSGVNPSDYASALRAYWLSPDMLGRDTAAKNTFVAVVGVNSSGVSWVRAFTGMPVGNEELLNDFNTMGEMPLDSSLIGSSEYNASDGYVKHTTGVFETALFGENSFERVSMGDGYSDLREAVQIPSGHYVWFGVVNFFALAIIWGLGVYFLMSSSANRSSDIYTNTRDRYRNW